MGKRQNDPLCPPPTSEDGYEKKTRGAILFETVECSEVCHNVDHAISGFHPGQAETHFASIFEAFSLKKT